MTKKILITGAAGFIGYHLTLKLISKGYKVVGIDNLNEYYNSDLKILRIKNIEKSSFSKNFNFFKIDLLEREELIKLFKVNEFNYVINLAAQAGVRYSFKNPESYVESNLVGFFNILEMCRLNAPEHLLFASSSSVYGMNSKLPFSSEDNTDHPINLYAATKKSNELLAYSYSHLYKINTSGFRFFTVYGPWGRPDMSYFLFTKAILDGKEISLFNNGEMERDFTYIDDITDGIYNSLKKKHKNLKSKYSDSRAPFKIYNIGNNNPINLKEFVQVIEELLNRKAIIKYTSQQNGEMPITYADIEDSKEDLKFDPKFDIHSGLKEFVNWYLDLKKSNPEVL